MALLIAILLAIFVLPAPWNLIAVAAAAVWELVTTLGAVWWSQRRTAQVGAEALLGRVVEVRDPCCPLGTVRIKGEIWRARCDEGASRGELVSVVGRDGLMLVVERARSADHALGIESQTSAPPSGRFAAPASPP